MTIKGLRSDNDDQAQNPVARIGQQRGADIFELPIRAIARAAPAPRKRSKRLPLLIALPSAALVTLGALWLASDSRPGRRAEFVGIPLFDFATPNVALLTGSKPDAKDEKPELTDEELAPLPVPEPMPILAAPPFVESPLTGVEARNPHDTPTLIFDAQAASTKSPASPARNVATAPMPAIKPAPAGAATLTRGTTISAVLETAIDADKPGMVRAIVGSEVRSHDGARLLVPRSSRLVGEYRGELSGGRKRVYVVWTKLTRPDGTVVTLAPNGTSDGFFQRFGAAGLLSAIDGGQQADAVGDQAAIRVRPGEPVRVFSAADVDLGKAP